MDYEEWIARERKIRLRILQNSREIRQTGVHRVCLNCEELCLCHEEACPNCGGEAIGERRIDQAQDFSGLGNRIRCRQRFDQLNRSSTLVTAGGSNSNNT